MGFSSSKSKSTQVSGPSPTQTKAANILLEAFRPGSSGTGGYVTQKSTPSMSEEDAIEGLLNPRAVSQKIDPVDVPGGKVGYGYEQGMKDTAATLGQQTYTDVLGKGMVKSPSQLTAEQASGVTNTLLPNMQEMRFKSVGEQMAAGRGSAEERQVISQAEAMAADPLGFARQAQEEVMNKIYEGKSLELPTLPPITDYINEVYTKLPDTMKGLIDEVITRGGSADISNVIDTTASQLLEQAQSTGDALMQESLARFSQAGAATGGAALAAAGAVASDIALQFGAQLLTFTNDALNRAQGDRQIAMQAIEQVTGVAAAQQAADLQADAINLDTLTRTLDAQAKQYTELVNTFVQQNQFYTGIINQSFQQMSQTEVQNFRMVYEVLLALATSGPGSSYGKSQSSSRGVNFSALFAPLSGSVIGSLFGAEGTGAALKIGQDAGK
jgi:hypothetical protein